MPVAVGMDSRHQGVLYGTGATEHALTVPVGLDTGLACAAPWLVRDFHLACVDVTMGLSFFH